MDLPAAGREYVTWPLTGLPSGVDVEMSYDGGTTWHPATLADDTVQVLCAGPDAEENPDGTVVLPLGVNVMSLRAVDSPEIVIRYAGTVDVH